MSEAYTEDGVAYMLKEYQLLVACAEGTSSPTPDRQNVYTPRWGADAAMVALADLHTAIAHVVRLDPTVKRVLDAAMEDGGPELEKGGKQHAAFMRVVASMVAFLNRPKVRRNGPGSHNSPVEGTNMIRVIELQQKALPSRCAVCYQPVRTLPSAGRPMYLCQECEAKWGSQRGEPWLKDMLREEYKRRNPNYREVTVGVLDLDSNDVLKDE